MTQPAYTTRAEASAPPAHQVRTAALGFYEVEREGTTLPPFERIEPRYQTHLAKCMAGAIRALEAAGYRIIQSREVS